MRIVYLLLHDFRFASIGLKEFASDRFHFSKEYARRMASYGHEVKLYVLTDEKTPKSTLERDGYEIKAFPARLSFPPGLKFGNSHSLEALRELEKDAPDVVHFHNYYLWNFPYAAAWVKMRGTPLVAQYHGTDPIRKVKGIGLYPSLRLCDRILVPLRKEYEFLKSIKVGEHRLSLFPSTGVDTGLFHRVAPQDHEPLLLYVGRIPSDPDYRWEKSPQRILPILRRLKDLGVPCRLAVVGDGPGLEEMRSQATALGLEESVEFMGPLAHDSLPEVYSRASLTFVPFQLDEVSPYWDGALQESLACGTPVAGFNSKKVGFSRYGLLIPPSTARAAELVAAALSPDSPLVNVAEEGPRAIAETCEWETLTRRLEGEYERISERRNS